MTRHIVRLFRQKLLNLDTPLLGRIGALETRLARSKSEIRKAQEIRYQVFYDEMGATANRRTKLRKRDKDKFDKYCDHLLVIDRTNDNEKIVGTYRLLPDYQARQLGGYYTQSEFEIPSLLKADSNQRMLEVGRSCILKSHRTKRTMELMWQGLWSYVLKNKIDVLFGCASFQGVDIRRHAEALSWLANNVNLDESEELRALTTDSIDLRTLRSNFDDPRKAMAGMPPLLKGYLRLGAKIGPQAVIDHQFGTVDVLVVLKVKDIAPRYLTHYGNDASRFAA